MGMTCHLLTDHNLIKQTKLRCDYESLSWRLETWKYCIIPKYFKSKPFVVKKKLFLPSFLKSCLYFIINIDYIFTYIIDFIIVSAFISMWLLYILSTRGQSNITVSNHFFLL